LARHNLHLVGIDGVDVTSHSFNDGAKEQLACLGDASSENDVGNVEKVDHVGDAEAEVDAGLPKNLPAKLIALPCVLRDHFRAELFKGFGRKLSERARRSGLKPSHGPCHDAAACDHCLEAAPVAAAAEGTARQDHGVADFARALPWTAIELAPYDDARAKAAADPNTNQIGDVFPGAQPLFGQRRHANDVFDKDRHPQLALQNFLERDVAKAQVVRVSRDAPFTVDEPRDSKTDAGDLAQGDAGFFEALVYKPHDELDIRARVLTLGGG